MCRVEIGLSPMEKWIFHDFLVKSSKFLTAIWFAKLTEIEIFCNILKYWIIPLIWYLICKNPISKSEMTFICIISTNLVDIDFRYQVPFYLGQSKPFTVNYQNIMINYGAIQALYCKLPKYDQLRKVTTLLKLRPKESWVTTKANGLSVSSLV